jgi:acyl-homoserine lactone acylase PvdQ
MFYPYRIKAGKLDFMAIEPAGTATFLFGHSSRFAWGVTEGPRFVADCYRIKVASADAVSYNYDGKTETIERVPYNVEVKGAPAVSGVFEYTRHNGVRSPVESRTADSVYVVSYAHAERMGLGAGQYYQMAKAKTRAEFENALAQGDLYPANLLVGGADGTVMFVRPGGVPIRPAGLDVRGTLDGNTSATAWRGMHPYRDLLKLIDPPQGFVANTNTSPDMMYEKSPMTEKSYPAYFGFETGRTNERQRRLLEILTANGRMTVDVAKATVMDETIPSTRKWGPQLQLAWTATRADIARQPADVQTCLNQLMQFDGEFSKDSSAALYHMELQRTVGANRELFERLSRGIQNSEPLDPALQEFLAKGATDACSNVQKKYGRAALTLGDVFRVGRGNVDLPVGSGQVPGTGVATVRALRFGPANPNGIQRLTGGQRAPFLVHFSPTGVHTYAQMLFGVSDDPASAHFSDQARLASDKLLPEIPLTRAALVNAGATARRIEVNRR